MARQRTEVPVEDIQRAVADSELSLGDIARNLDWISPDRDGRARPDTARLKRQLGLEPNRPGGGRAPRFQKGMHYERAVEVVLAAGVTPMDYGV